MKKPYWYLKLADAIGKQYYFILKAPNGETILSSEMYDSKQGAINGIKSIRANVGGQIKDLTN